MKSGDAICRCPAFLSITIVVPVADFPQQFEPVAVGILTNGVEDLAYGLLDPPQVHFVLRHALSPDGNAS